MEPVVLQAVLGYVLPRHNTNNAVISIQNDQVTESECPEKSSMQE